MDKKNLKFKAYDLDERRFCINTVDGVQTKIFSMFDQDVDRFKLGKYAIDVFVGQCDENGEMIFDNDILKDQNGYFYIVKYDNLECCFNLFAYNDYVHKYNTSKAISWFDTYYVVGSAHEMFDKNNRPLMLGDTVKKENYKANWIISYSDLQHQIIAVDADCNYIWFNSDGFKYLEKVK